MKLVTLDWVIIGAYFVLSLVTGLYYARHAGRSAEEYFLSNRFNRRCIHRNLNAVAPLPFSNFPLPR